MNGVDAAEQADVVRRPMRVSLWNLCASHTAILWIGVFDDYKRGRRVHAANHPVPFTISASLLVAIYFTAQFRNVLAGIGGGALTALIAWYWWRPGGPGQRRYGSPRP
jgi:hypothetical protein